MQIFCSQKNQENGLCYDNCKEMSWTGLTKGCPTEKNIIWIAYKVRIYMMSVVKSVYFVYFVHMYKAM